jgi:hypothetical protein
MASVANWPAQLKAKGATVIVTGRTPERIEAAKAAGYEVMADLSTAGGRRCGVGGGHRASTSTF